MAQLDLTPPDGQARGDELSPLGHLPQLNQTHPSPDQDAALLAATVLGQPDETRTGVPLNVMNHGGQPGKQTKTPYDQYKHQGREGGGRKVK